MPAVSKKQQKFMGIVHAIQKGEANPSKYSKQAQDAAKKMKKKSAKDYAKTKHTGLPTRKTESGILYKAGVKKYGKEGMKKIQQAAGKRKSHAEIGKIKDKYEKGKKESVREDNIEFSKEEMAILHKDGQIKKDGHVYVYSESDLPITTKKQKVIQVKHKTSGKELIVVDTPKWRKKYKQMGFVVQESVNEVERDYKDEYKKFQSSSKAKKYRAELNKYNRKKGTYGNGDGKDASHKGGKIAGFEKESINRGRREKSRLKKEDVMLDFEPMIDEIVDSVIKEYSINEDLTKLRALYAQLDKQFKNYNHKKISDFNKVDKYLKSKFKKGSSLPDIVASFYNDYRGGEEIGKNHKRLFKYAKKMQGESVNEGDKRQYRDVYGKYYKTYEAFAREVMNLAKSASKISGNKTDEKIILKNFKKQVIPFAGLMSSWSKGRESNPHIDEGLLSENPAAMAAAAMATTQIMGAQGKKIKASSALQSSDPRVKKKAKSMFQRLKDKFAKKKKEKGFEKQKKKVAKGAAKWVSDKDKQKQTLKSLGISVARSKSQTNEANVIQKIDKLAKRNKYGTVDGTRMNGKTAKEIMAIFKHPKMNSYRRQMTGMKSHELVDLTLTLLKPLKIKVESVNEKMGPEQYHRYMQYVFDTQFKTPEEKKMKKSIIKKINVAQKKKGLPVFKEGSCGYGIGGKVGNQPAGPHLLKKKKKMKESRQAAIFTQAFDKLLKKQTKGKQPSLKDLEKVFGLMRKRHGELSGLGIQGAFESVNEAGGVVTARIQQKPKGYWAVFNKRGQSQFEGNKKFMINILKKASTLSPNAIGSILDRARPGDKHLEFKAQFSRYYFDESVNEVSGVDVAKKVLKNKQYEKGIDLQTANLIVTIDKAYDKNPKLQKKFRAIPLPKMKQLVMKYYG